MIEQLFKSANNNTQHAELMPSKDLLNKFHGAGSFKLGTDIDVLKTMYWHRNSDCHIRLCYPDCIIWL